MQVILKQGSNSLTINLEECSCDGVNQLKLEQNIKDELMIVAFHMSIKSHNIDAMKSFEHSQEFWRWQYAHTLVYKKIIYKIEDMYFSCNAIAIAAYYGNIDALKYLIDKIPNKDVIFNSYIE